MNEELADTKAEQLQTSAANEEISELQQQVEDSRMAIATIQAHRETALKKIKEQSVFMCVVSEERIGEAIDASNFEKDEESEAQHKAEYEESLQEAIKKQTAAVALVQKLKSVASQKLKAAAEERASAQEKLIKDQAEAEARLKMEFESQLEAAEKVRVSQISELETRIESVVAESAAEIEKITKVQEGYEAKLTATQEEKFNSTLSKLAENEAYMSDGMQKEFDALLKKRGLKTKEDHAEVLLQTQAHANSQLDSSREEHEELTKNLHEQLDAILTKAEAEKEYEIESARRSGYEQKLKSAVENHDDAEIQNPHTTMEKHSDVSRIIAEDQEHEDKEQEDGDSIENAGVNDNENNFSEHGGVSNNYIGKTGVGGASPPESTGVSQTKGTSAKGRYQAAVGEAKEEETYELYSESDMLLGQNLHEAEAEQRAEPITLLPNKLFGSQQERMSSLHMELNMLKEARDQEPFHREPATVAVNAASNLGGLAAERDAALSTARDLEHELMAADLKIARFYTYRITIMASLILQGVLEAFQSAQIQMNFYGFSPSLPRRAFHHSARATGVCWGTITKDGQMDRRIEDHGPAWTAEGDVA
jgi:hypothetical protein